MIRRCQVCGRKGRLGMGVRSYEVASPVAVFTTEMCFKCFEKQTKKKRKHVTIKDKVHATPRPV